MLLVLAILRNSWPPLLLLDLEEVVHYFEVLRDILFVCLFFNVFFLYFFPALLCWQMLGTPPVLTYNAIDDLKSALP